MSMAIDTVRSVGAIDDAVRPVRENVLQTTETRLLVGINAIELGTQAAEALAARCWLLYLRPTAIVVRPEAQEGRVTDDRGHFSECSGYKQCKDGEEKEGSRGKIEEQPQKNL